MIFRGATIECRDLPKANALLNALRGKPSGVIRQSPNAEEGGGTDEADALKRPQTN